MTYAIIETGGKQMRVEPGRFYDVELLHVEPEGSYTIDKVLLVHHEDDISIGQPFVSGAIVNGTVLRHFRGRKIIVYKMRPKKKTRKKRGHRQEITRLLIDSISLDGKIIAGEEVAATSPIVETEAPEVEVTDVVEAEAPEVAATEVVDTPVEAIPEVETTQEVEASTPAAEKSTSAPKKKKK